MAVAERSETIELQHMDDAIYDNIDTRPAAQERCPLQEQHHVDTTTAAEVAEEGHYDRLDVQQMDDATYEDFQTKTKKEKDLMKTMQADIRWYKRGRVRVRLLCAALVLLTIAVPLYLHQSNMAERQQLLSSFELSQNIHNLTEQKDQLLSSLEKLEAKLEVRYEKLEARRDKLETTLIEEREQFQTVINDLKMRLCEQHGFSFSDGLCYYISTEKKTWAESIQWCRDRQADLMIIKSKAKQDLVASFNKRVWLGLTDRETEGSFQWVDGTPMTTPTYWMSGQPHAESDKNPNEEQDCVEYYDGSQSTPNRGWNDARCSISKYWMCERSYASIFSPVLI